MSILVLFVFFRMIKDPGSNRSPCLHRTFGAEFLAAETVNANASIDARPALKHCNCLRRTYLGTLAAADAVLLLQLWKRSHDPRCYKISYFAGYALSENMKENAGLRRYCFEIRNPES